MTTDEMAAHIAGLTLDPYLTPKQYRMALIANPPAGVDDSWISRCLWADAVRTAVNDYKPQERPQPPTTGDLFGGNND